MSSKYPFFYLPAKEYSFFVIFGFAAALMKGATASVNHKIHSYVRKDFR